VPQRSIPVVLDLGSCAPTAGVATVIDRTPPARIGRAVLSLIGLWAGACVCVLIPLLHFVLVPGLLIAGIVLFAVRLREDCSLHSVTASCPRCAVERVYAPGGRFYDGRVFHCDGCGEQPRLTVQPRDRDQKNR
jgi:hypothetical protein